MSDELKVAIEAAKKGAEEALKYYQTDLEVEFKEDKSPVTIADKKTEEVVKQSILSRYPNAEFVAEESGGNTASADFWSIDPIDGTRSYSRGVPTWCVIVAKYKKGKMVLGVVYFPILKQLLYAEKEKGAYLNDKKVHVSSVSTLRDAYVAYGSYKHFKDKSSVIRLIESAAGARSPDITWATLLVATGNMDATVDSYAQIWDYAPFEVIINEAGGQITNMEGRPWKPGDRGFVATNGILHDEIIRVLNQKKVL